MQNVIRKYLSIYKGMLFIELNGVPVAPRTIILNIGLI